MSNINVMVNGLPGNVALIIAEHVMANERLNLIPYSLTGPEIEQPDHKVGEAIVKLVRPEARDQVIAEVRSSFGAFLSVDFTHPTAVNSNADFYCRHRLPFVMGTTGEIGSG